MRSYDKEILDFDHFLRASEKLLLLLWRKSVEKPKAERFATKLNTVSCYKILI